MEQAKKKLGLGKANPELDKSSDKKRGKKGTTTVVKQHLMVCVIIRKYFDTFLIIVYTIIFCVAR